MDTAVINIKTDPVIKKKAQKIAAELGISLSSLIDAQLRQFVRTKTFNVSLSERPSPWMKRELRKSKKDIEEGWVSPGFTNVEDSMKWLNSSRRRYANGKVRS